MDVTARIMKYMRQRGWSVYRLSKESGLSQSTLSHVFRRDSEPTISTLKIICDVFGISLCQFFSDGDFVALNEEQRIVLDLWSALTCEQRELLLKLMANMK